MAMKIRGKHTRTIGWILCSVLLYLLPFPVQGSYFKHLGMSDGLSHLSVRSFCQDKLGRIWIGTQEGVSIFDGRTVQGYKSIKEGPIDSLSLNRRNPRIGNLVTCIVGDGLGNIYMLVDNRLIKYDLEQETFNVLSDRISALTSYRGDVWCVRNDSIFKYDSIKGFSCYMKVDLKRIRLLLLLDDNAFWIGTVNGLYRIDSHGKKETVLKTGDIRALFQDKDKNIWIGTLGDGCFCIPSGESLKANPVPLLSPSGVQSLDIRCFTQDKQGCIWVGTFEGVYKLEPFNQGVTFYTSDGIENSLQHSSIYALLTDRDGTVWIGSYYGGVNYLTERARGFKRYNYNPYRNDCLGFPFVGNMVEDKRGNLWICLDGGGLTCLERKKGTFTRYVASAHGLPHNNLRTICYDDKKDLLYIGTHKGGLASLDIKSGVFNNYEAQKGKEFPGWIIDHVQMWNDSLLVAARNGLFILDGETGKGRKLSNYMLLHFDVDSEGILWGISASSFFYMNLKSKDVLHRIPISDMEKLTFSSVLNAGKKVCIATLGAGIIVYDKAGKEFKRLNKSDDNLLSNYCYSICQTRKGNFLFSTDRGIFLYNPLLDKFYNVEQNALFAENSIVAGCGLYACHDNELFVGGTNGMASFMEKEIFKPSTGLGIFFTQLFVNNGLVKPNDGSKILDKTLPMVEGFSLPYDKNNLLITFATSDVGGNNHAVQYEYCLQGFDDSWSVTDKFEVRYTNLPPGKYCLKVRAKGLMKEEIDVLHEASLSIHVNNVWYVTWWAKLVLILILVGGVWWTYRVREARRKFVLSLEKEQLEKQHLEDLNQAKLRFFTNISHEFKTPLTLISTQMEIVGQNKQLPASVRFQLSKISRYVKQLNELITELLDFRKIEQEKMKLELSEQSLSFFLKEMFYTFSEHAKQHQIRYHFDDNLLSSDQVWFDVRQMQKVMLNLLSNAFKFTPDGGQISLIVKEVEGMVEIGVSDTGIGISDEDLPYVFDRFYQSGGTIGQGKRKNGTGIGLALAKSIVELHHGKIRVESQIGEGTCFVVELPVDKAVYGADEDVEWKKEAVLPERMEMDAEDFLSDDVLWVAPEGDWQRKKLLIVEDNLELGQMLYQLFAPLYEVIMATNGQEGLERVREEAPDLVLSDVMMPEMSGTEMCRQIKSSLDLCHIPVILLTALDSPESNIEGLRMGADDYVTKPFDVRLLLTRCNNMVRNRQLVKEKYTKKMDSELSMLATNALDKKFLEDIVHIIDDNLDNADFDIPFLCQKIGMSRTAFQRKFKALTNLTPNDFVIQHKLKMAADMIVREKNLQIGEIADKLGFGSAKYFSRLFKDLFGSSPVEYRKASVEKEGDE